MTGLIWSLARLLEAPDGAAALDPSPREVRAEFDRMRNSPVPLARPVVVLAGYRAWSMMPRSVAATLARLTTGRSWRDDFLPIAYPWSTNISAIAGRVARCIAERWPSREVDVVGVSMGGLVARCIAAGLTEPPAPPTPVHTLFTLATPHQGAVLATRIRPDAAARDMKPGSAFLARLDEAQGRPSELVCYARLRDTWVGASRTAPAGHAIRWVRGWRAFSHLTVASDGRILADIAHRLRGEAAWPCQEVAPPRD